MEKRYIDLDKALDEFETWVSTSGGLIKGTSYYHECRHCFEGQDIEDVTPVVHGYWENKPSTACKAFVPCCSVCGNSTLIRYKYCSHCGAKMDKEPETT